MSFPPRQAVLDLLFHPNPAEVHLALLLLEGLAEDADVSEFLYWIGADLWQFAYARYDRDFPNKAQAQAFLLELLQASDKELCLRAENTEMHISQIAGSLEWMSKYFQAEILAEHLCKLPLNYWAKAWPTLLHLLQDCGALQTAPLPNPRTIWERNEEVLTLAGLEMILSAFPQLKNTKDLALYWWQRGL